MPNASLPKPIAVTDAQMGAILTAATPLPPSERSTISGRHKTSPAKQIGSDWRWRAGAKTFRGNCSRGLEAAARGRKAAGASSPPGRRADPPDGRDCSAGKIFRKLFLTANDPRAAGCGFQFQLVPPG